MPKLPNYRRVKIHLSYTVEGVARLLEVHKNTVRAWLKSGLAKIDDRRPTMILGKTFSTRADRTRSSPASRGNSTACAAVRRGFLLAEWWTTRSRARQTGDWRRFARFATAS